MNTVHAYTERSISSYPAYYNLSQDDQGMYILIVRSRGGNGSQSASIELEPDELRELAKDIHAQLGDEP